MIDARGKWVTPGIVAGFSRLGLSEVDLSASAHGRPTRRQRPFSAAIDVAPAINPNGSTIAGQPRGRSHSCSGRARTPRKSIFAGQGAVIDLGADMEPITRARAVPVRRAW